MQQGMLGWMKDGELYCFPVSGTEVQWFFNSLPKTGTTDSEEP